MNDDIVGSPSNWWRQSHARGLPLALANRGPVSTAQWLGFLVCGVLGSVGHYCLTRGFAATDLSAMQSAKFLDLVCAAALGCLFFADEPTETTTRRASHPTRRCADHPPLTSPAAAAAAQAPSRHLAA